MEIGLDGIAASSGDGKSTKESGVLTITNLLDQIELAD